ncbi:MAG: cupin domain-containing protein, partial [Pseudomonadota bacterium]|nr:cupin domain-containing protein [Pseudomonadota bacterium]
MSVARHPRPPELEGVQKEEIVDKFVARFAERRADWEAFEAAKLEGWKRAQHRYIGAGGSGKHDDIDAI